MRALQKNRMKVWPIVVAPLLLAAAALGLQVSQRRPESQTSTPAPRYYMCVFSYDGVPPSPEHAHTFATFIKCAHGATEAHTISWLPRSDIVKIRRSFCEPGVNHDLHDTLRRAKGSAAHIYEWGPYQIQPELFARALRQIDKLNSGRLQYKALDGYEHPNTASNCIHAVSDIDMDHGSLTVDCAYGKAAGAKVVEHLAGWIIQPRRQHAWIDKRLGLDQYGITHGSIPSPPNEDPGRDPP
jgi:hypothetical protein